MVQSEGVASLASHEEEFILGVRVEAPNSEAIAAIGGWGMGLGAEVEAEGA